MKEKIDFYSNRSASDGLTSYCKECTKAKVTARDRARGVKPKVYANTSNNPRECTGCKIVKNVEEFHWKIKHKNLRQPLCKVCQIPRVRPYRRNIQYKNRYGITEERYNEMYDEQDGCCAICKIHFQKDGSKTERLYLDHCHRSKKVRKLLCFWCNSGLGYFKDNIEYLKNAYDYLVVLERKDNA